MCTKCPRAWLVAWDFAMRPKRNFYEILRDEFPNLTIQRSVALCNDDFTARRLRALCEYYGANVIAYAIAPLSLDDTDGDAEASEFIERIHAARRARQGRRI